MKKLKSSGRGSPKKMEFFSTDNAADNAYSNIRDLPHYGGDKKFVEDLWEKYQHLADKTLLSDAKRHLQERFWEMYLGVTLLDHCFKLAKPGYAVPAEFYFETNSLKVWVEAIAPGPGTTADAVPDIEYFDVQRIHQDENYTGIQELPENEIILRLTQAITDKHKRYMHYINKGIVDTNDAFIIAINGQQLRFHPFLGGFPLILKAVFPYGDLTSLWDTAHNEITKTYYVKRDSICRKSGSPVSTDIFIDPKYGHISGVLCSGVDPLNRPQSMGADFVFVHNPNAINKLPLGLFKFGREYWLEYHLKEKNWNDDVV